MCDHWIAKRTTFGELCLKTQSRPASRYARLVSKRSGNEWRAALVRRELGRSKLPSPSPNRHAGWLAKRSMQWSEEREQWGVTAVKETQGNVYVRQRCYALWKERKPDKRLLLCGRLACFCVWRNAHNCSLYCVVLGAVDRCALWVWHQYLHLTHIRVLGNTPTRSSPRLCAKSSRAFGSSRPAQRRH